MGNRFPVLSRLGLDRTPKRPCRDFAPRHRYSPARGRSQPSDCSSADSACYIIFNRIGLEQRDVFLRSRIVSPRSPYEMNCSAHSYWYDQPPCPRPPPPGDLDYVVYG
jgi:hypothetical protein